MFSEQGLVNVSKLQEERKAYHCPHISPSDPLLESLIDQLDRIDQFNQLYLSVCKLLFVKSLKCLKHCVRIGGIMHQLVSKHLGVDVGDKSDKEPLTKTLEEEQVQGYNYAIRSIIQLCLPFLNGLKRISQDKCAVMDRAIRNVKFKIIQYEFYQLVCNRCPLCPAKQSRQIPGDLKGKVHETAVRKSEEYRLMLKSQLPPIIEGGRMFISQIGNIPAYVHLEVSAIISIELEHYMKAWRQDSESAVKSNSEVSSINDSLLRSHQQSPEIIN